MRKIRHLFEPVKLTEDQEKWLSIGVVSAILALFFYVLPVVLAITFIGDLITDPIWRVILFGIVGVITLLTVHFTFRYGFRLCVRMAIRNYEVEQAKKEKKKRAKELSDSVKDEAEKREGKSIIELTENKG